jgi:hypothetical protein
MGQHISERARLNLVAEVARRFASGDLSAAEVQALLEKEPVSESSLGSKVIGEWEGATFTEYQIANDRLVYLGQVLRRHRNGGGWVPLEQDEYDQTKPFVAESAYVGPFAMVFGNARVYGYARVCGNQTLSSGSCYTGHKR